MTAIGRTTQSLDFTEVDIDPLTEMTVEALQQLATSCEKTADWKDRVRRMLTALKPKVGHGNWQEYCREHFAHLGSVRTLQMYMRPDSEKDELRAICDQSQPSAKSANVAHLKTGQVKVGPVEEPQHEADTPSESVLSVAKTSKDSRKVPEAKKKKTEPITPEIVEHPEMRSQYISIDDADSLLEACIKVCRTTVILKGLVLSCSDGAQAELGKQLRKAADTVDPPKKFRPPEVEEVAAYCQERGNNVDSEAFVAHYKANGWKLKNNNKMQDWKAAVITWEKWEKNNGRGNRNSGALTGSDW